MKRDSGIPGSREMIDDPPSTERIDGFFWVPAGGVPGVRGDGARGGPFVREDIAGKDAEPHAGEHPGDQGKLEGIVERQYGAFDRAFEGCGYDEFDGMVGGQPRQALQMPGDSVPVESLEILLVQPFQVFADQFLADVRTKRTNILQPQFHGLKVTLSQALRQASALSGRSMRSRDRCGRGKMVGCSQEFQSRLFQRRRLGHQDLGSGGQRLRGDILAADGGPFDVF